MKKLLFLMALTAGLSSNPCYSSEANQLPKPLVETIKKIKSLQSRLMETKNALGKRMAEMQVFKMYEESKPLDKSFLEYQVKRHEELGQEVSAMEKELTKLQEEISEVNQKILVSMAHLLETE